MFGHGRDRAGVLVELKPAHAVDVVDPAALTAARDALWPAVAEANSAAPAFSRIFKETILIAGRGKPLPRAGKGTVMRKAALATYAREIDEMCVSPVLWNLGYGGADDFFFGVDMRVCRCL